MARNPPGKVLIINTFGIGDVLFTTPLISNLKTAYPDVYIGYLCNRRTSPLLEHNTKVNRIFIYARDELNVIYKRSRRQYWKVFGAFVRGIKEERFDIVLDVSLSGFTAFLTWWIGIPYRVGFDYKRRGFFMNKKIPFKGYEDKHVVEYYLDLLREIGVPIKHKVMEFPLVKEDMDWASGFLKENGVPVRGPVIGLVPGGGESWGKEAVYKRWPAGSFAKLADKLIEKSAAQIILLGGPPESQLCEEIVRGMRNPCLSLCGKTSLTQFAALAQQCSLIVTNDGGSLHAAVAAGSKTVSIFGPVDDAVYGPYPFEGHMVVKKDLACQPCYRRFRRAQCEHIRCLKQLSVEEVIGKVEAIL
ncbi:MAG: lipopolysaccharide heptosyltransferase II [Candidatus Omnitrophica bacterium]|nr:lipopolysaccharide heptosyltransferase II [Candidatus Omnitrophota bacterium]